MSEYIERNSPFPELSDKLKTLLFAYYEAEFEGEVVKALLIKDEIERLKFRMSLGEKYEVPF
jgi:hypothetical protein